MFLWHIFLVIDTLFLFSGTNFDFFNSLFKFRLFFYTKGVKKPIKHFSTRLDLHFQNKYCLLF